MLCLVRVGLSYLHGDGIVSLGDCPLRLGLLLLIKERTLLLKIVAVLQHALNVIALYHTHYTLRLTKVKALQDRRRLISTPLVLYHHLHSPLPFKVLIRYCHPLPVGVASVFSQFLLKLMEYLLHGVRYDNLIRFRFLLLDLRQEILRPLVRENYILTLECTYWPNLMGLSQG